MDVYPELRSGKRTWPISGLEDGPPYPLERLFLFIDTDIDVSGMYGPVPTGEARFIARRFVPLLIGENPHAVQRMWDKMYRAVVYAPKGLAMMALSKVDLALWDLKGKLFDAPVYELLGGPTRPRIRAYASMLGYSVEPERAAQRSKEMVEQGYTAMKWFCRYGPPHGPEGERKNLALIEAVRDAVGPDVDIMFDAWNSWDVPYTQRMAQRAADYRPWWFEEPVMPDMVHQYAELRRTVSTVAIAGGEHAYTRWGAKSLLDAGAVDILQLDPWWGGGLTELVKVCALASAEGIPMIPHHGAIASTHLVASQPLTTCPIQEWILQAGARDNAFLKHKLDPQDGFIELPKVPGLGMEFDEDVIESREEVQL